MTTAYHPQMSGQPERFNKTIIPLLRPLWWNTNKTGTIMCSSWHTPIAGKCITTRVLYHSVKPSQGYLWALHNSNIRQHCRSMLKQLPLRMFCEHDCYTDSRQCGRKWTNKWKRLRAVIKTITTKHPQCAKENWYWTVHVSRPTTNDDIHCRAPGDLVV